MIRAGILFFLFFPVGLCAQTFQSSQTTVSRAFLQLGNRERDRIFTDYSNLYNQNNVKNFGVALLGAGVMANTKIDGNFQRWYFRHDIMESDENDMNKMISGISKTFGEGAIFIPVTVASAFTYRFFQEKQGLSECCLGEFADRTMRGYFVGFPTLLVAQSVLGGGRPGEGSYWRPFRQNHGVSGHAFIGAIPFMTAAQMTDKPCVKGLFYVLSALPAWSRVNDDAHYLSQSLLGWYLAYLSVRAVSETEERRTLPRGLTIFPVSGGGSVGVGLHYQF